MNGHGKDADSHGRLKFGAISQWVLDAGGAVDALIRADTIAEFETAALARGLLNDVEGTLRPAEHVEIAGAVLDEQGEVVTPAVLDTRPHYDLRIHDDALTRLATDGFTPRWEETVGLWMAGPAIPEQAKNKNENGRKLSGVTLIDPASVTRSHRFL
jgi:hypothetical protein